MTFTTPATVSPGDKYNASAHNIVVSDLLDLDSRITSATNYVAPTGSILSYVTTTAPTGWLICNGSQVSKTTYSALFSIVGANKFGTDAGDLFYLPDLRGRIPVGVGTNADINVIGDNEAGDKTAGLAGVVADRSPKHQHTVYDPTHGHSNRVGIGAAGVTNSSDVVVRSNAGTQDGAFVATNPNATGIKINPQNAATSTSPVDASAFLTLNFIIKT